MKLLLTAILLIVTTLSFPIERKESIKVYRDFSNIGTSSVETPNKWGGKDPDTEEVKNLAVFDEIEELYNLTYWTGKREKIEFKFEPVNKLTFEILSRLSYDKELNEYRYFFTIRNSESSKQMLKNSIILMEPEIIYKEKIFFKAKKFKSWVIKKNHGDQEWLAFPFSQEKIRRGQKKDIEFFSAYGPILAYCYSHGKAKNYPSPPEMGPGRGYPTKEGAKTLTIAPGQITIPRTELNSYIKNIFDQSVEWRWIEQNIYDDLVLNISNSSEDISKPDFKNILDRIKNEEELGNVVPEVLYLLKHVDIKFFDGKW